MSNVWVWWEGLRFLPDDVDFSHLIVFVTWCSCIVSPGTQGCSGFSSSKGLNRHAGWLQLTPWPVGIDFARPSASISHVHWHQPTRRLASTDSLASRHRFRTSIGINFTRPLASTDSLASWFKGTHGTRAGEGVHFFLGAWPRRQLGLLVLDSRQRCTHRR